MIILAILGFLGVALAIFIIYGPRQTVDTQAAFAPVIIPQNIDEYLRDSEAIFHDIVEDAHKQIIWAGDAGQKTDYAVIYLHGFSATSHEIRPVPEKVAKTLGANIYYTRFSGHGRTGDAMLDGSPEKWVQDAIEAVEIGTRIGRKIIILATSNGGAICSYVMADPNYASKVSGIVFTSPAYKLANPLTALLDFPLIRYWGTYAAGKRFGFNPLNADHEKYWTSEYPSQSVLSMTTVQRELRKVQFERIKTPALFFVSDEDSVIKASAVKQVAFDWGGDSRLVVRKLTAQDDPYNHILSGDILSPNQTVETVGIITDWIAELEQSSYDHDGQANCG